MVIFVVVKPSFFFWHFLLFVSVVFEGINGQANGWLNGHATFYGANQSPATLGKILYIDRYKYTEFKIIIDNSELHFRIYMES